MPVGGEEDRKPNPVYHFYFLLSLYPHRLGPSGIASAKEKINFSR